MTALTPTFAPTSIVHRDGRVFIGRVELDRGQQTALLAIWAEERCQAMTKLDEPVWRAAADLHGSLLRAVLDADAYRREALPQHKPMSAFGASIFEMFGAGR